MYPLEFKKIINGSAQTDDVREDIKILNLFFTKLNEKLIFPDQVPNIFEVDNETGLFEGISYLVSFFLLAKYYR